MLYASPKISYKCLSVAHTLPLLLLMRGIKNLPSLGNLVSKPPLGHKRWNSHHHQQQQQQQRQHPQAMHTHTHTRRQTHSRAYTHTFIISFMAECPVAFVVHVVTGLYPSLSLYVCVCVWVCPLVCVMQSRVKKQQQIKRVAPFASLHMYYVLYLYLCVVCKDIERLIKLRQLDGQLLDNETQPTGDCQQACHSPQPPLPPLVACSFCPQPLIPMSKPTNQPGVGKVLSLALPIHEFVCTSV